MIKDDHKPSRFVTISFFVALFMLLSHGIGSGFVGGTYSFSKIENDKYYLFGNSNRDTIPGKQWHEVSHDVYMYSMIHEYALYLSWAALFVGIFFTGLLRDKRGRNRNPTN